MTEFEKIRKTIDTYCGLCCADCEFREKMNCKGCVASQGQPFHGECPVARCAMERKRGFCGECPDFPCQLLQDYSNDPEHGDTPKGARISRCSQIKARLVAAARVGVDPQGVCGHHCDRCPYTPYCGGCRSVYPHCSFATLFEDGQCPNVTCAKEKNLTGCYECSELASCKKGYFGAEDGYTAKNAAQALADKGSC